jgi:hypothetical protein
LNKGGNFLTGHSARECVVKKCRFFSMARQSDTIYGCPSKSFLQASTGSNGAVNQQCPLSIKDPETMSDCLNKKQTQSKPKNDGLIAPPSLSHQPPVGIIQLDKTKMIQNQGNVKAHQIFPIRHQESTSDCSKKIWPQGGTANADLIAHPTLLQSSQSQENICDLETTMGCSQRNQRTDSVKNVSLVTLSQNTSSISNNTLPQSSQPQGNICDLETTIGCSQRNQRTDSAENGSLVSLAQNTSPISHYQSSMGNINVEKTSDCSKRNRCDIDTGEDVVSCAHNKSSTNSQSPIVVSNLETNSDCSKSNQHQEGAENHEMVESVPHLMSRSSNLSSASIFEKESALDWTKRNHCATEKDAIVDSAAHNMKSSSHQSPVSTGNAETSVNCSKMNQHQGGAANVEVVVSAASHQQSSVSTGIHEVEPTSDCTEKNHCATEEDAVVDSAASNSQSPTHQSPASTGNAETSLNCSNMNQHQGVAANVEVVLSAASHHMLSSSQQSSVSTGVHEEEPTSDCSKRNHCATEEDAVVESAASNSQSPTNQSPASASDVERRLDYLKKNQKQGGGSDNVETVELVSHHIPPSSQQSSASICEKQPTSDCSKRNHCGTEKVAVVGSATHNTKSSSHQSLASTSNAETSSSYLKKNEHQEGAENVEVVDLGSPHMSPSNQQSSVSTLENEPFSDFSIRKHCCTEKDVVDDSNAQNKSTPNSQSPTDFRNMETTLDRSKSNQHQGGAENVDVIESVTHLKSLSSNLSSVSIHEKEPTPDCAKRNHCGTEKDAVVDSVHQNTKPVSHKSPASIRNKETSLDCFNKNQHQGGGENVEAVDSVIHHLSSPSHQSALNINNTKKKNQPQYGVENAYFMNPGYMGPHWARFQGPPYMQHWTGYPYHYYNYSQNRPPVYSRRGSWRAR